MKDKKKIAFGAGVFFAALLVRFLFSLRFTTPWVGDEPVWFAYSMNVFHGQYYGSGGAYVAPGFAFFAGFLFKLFGRPTAPDITVIEMAHAFLGAFTAVFICLISSRLFKNSLAGFLSGLAYAFLPTAKLYTGMNYSETLWVFLVFLAVWLTLVSLEKRRPLFYILSGIAYGLSALTRPTSLPLAFLTLILFLFIGIKNRDNWRRIVFPPLLIAVFTLLTIMPWTIRNYSIYKELVLVDVNSGINLYLAHNEKSTGFWLNMGKNDPVIRLGHLTQADKLGKKLAKEYIKAHLDKTLEQAMKVNAMFWTKENADIKKYGIYRLKVLQKFYPFSLLSFLGLLGMVLSAKKYWRHTSWIIAYMAAYNGLIAFLYFAPRYRYAIEPFLTVFAGYSVYLACQIVYSTSKKLLFRLERWGKNESITAENR